MALPAVMVAAAMALPLAYLLLRGATATDEAWALLFRPRTAQILGRSALLVLTVTAGSVALAVPLAWLTVRTDLPLRRLWSVLAALPLVIPSYVGGFLLVSALSPRGLARDLLSGPFGVERLPDIHGLWGATLTLTLLSYPYVMLTVRGALHNLNPALQESARGLGLGPAAVALRVTIPQLRPALAAGGLLVALYTLSDFGAVSLLGYETFTWAIFQQYQTSFDRSVAAVLSLVLVALALLILLLEARTRGRARYHQSASGASRPARTARLGRWKWPAVAFCASVVSAALVLPMAVLGYWLVRGVLAGEPLRLLAGSILNSASVSAMAALTAALFAVPVAVLVVRYPSITARIVERLSFTGFALPGIVVALSLVFFGANFAGPVYQTVWLLLLAYVVLFFPAALGTTRAALLQVPPSLEEAARSLGLGSMKTLARVTVPLTRGGLMSGAALVFLLAIKELPATLILGPPGFKTLATSIWSASSEAFFAQAATPALVLIFISSVPMAYLMWRDGRIR